NPGTLLAGEERIKTRLTDLRWIAGHHRPLKFGRDIASGLCERTLLQAVFAGAASEFCPAMIVDGDRGSNTECGCCQYIGGGHGLHQKWRRSEEHTSELQSHLNLVCRLLLEKKKKKKE